MAQQDDLKPQDDQKPGLIDDSSIIPPGWVWTPEESAGVEVDPAQIAELIDKMLSDAGADADQPAPASATDGVEPVADAPIIRYNYSAHL